MILNISLTAQTIKGTIVSESGTTLTSATIKNLNNDKTTITNGNGFFQISANPNDTIEISYIGFQPIIDRAINLSKKDTLILKEKTTTLNNIVVTSINPLSIVTKIVSKNKQYIPKSFNYDVYVKTTVSINAELLYYSDAILNYVGNGKKMNTYIKASRCIRKSDTTMEKIFAKGTIYENLKQPFEWYANFDYNSFKDNIDDLRKNYNVSINQETNNMIVIQFIPKEDKVKLKDQVIWYVDKSDSLIREIHFNLLPKYIGTSAYSNIAAKRFFKDDKLVIKYKKEENNLVLSSIYQSRITDLHSGLLTKFDNKDFQMDRVWIVDNFSKTKDTMVDQNVKEYRDIISLQRYGEKNYSYNFWENQPIQLTQTENQFLNLIE